MKSVFDQDKDIDFDPDGTTIRELNKTIHEQTIELFNITKITEELQEAYTQEMLLNGELAHKIDKLTTTLVSYEATIGLLRDALEDIADEDFRGNRSSGSIKAFNALKQMGWRK